MTKKGAPDTSAEAQQKSGSGTVTPAPKAARSKANSVVRGKLAASTAALSVRSTQRSGAPPRETSSAQFC
jgi:hypothetical protein